MFQGDIQPIYWIILVSIQRESLTRSCCCCGHYISVQSFEECFQEVYLHTYFVELNSQCLLVSIECTSSSRTALPDLALVNAVPFEALQHDLIDHLRPLVLDASRCCCLSFSSRFLLLWHLDASFNFFSVFKHRLVDIVEIECFRFSEGDWLRFHILNFDLTWRLPRLVLRHFDETVE